MSSTRTNGRTALSCEQLEDRLALDATSFVKALYQNVLGRSADSSGLAFWVNQIQSNGLSNQQVASDIWGSTEHRRDEVNSYYETYLHRAPDASGLAFWANELLNGTYNEQGVQTLFMSSAEYIAAHNTPGTFVQSLYLNILSRLPTAGELSFWENTLAIDGAIDVTGSILTSTESYTNLIDSYYANYLNRTVDASGLDNWLSKLQSGSGTVESVAESILGSAEYANVH
jgi:Domain of unknown function (DUF4214)